MGLDTILQRLRACYNNSMGENKRCSKCGVNKVLQEFYRSQRNKDSHSVWCKRCSSHYCSMWGKANKARISLRGKARYIKHKRVILKKQAEYVSKNKLAVYRQRAARRYSNKNAVLQILGHKCVCCGEIKPGLLTLGHIGTNGKEDRRKYGGTHGLYRYLYNMIRQDQELPSMYGVECYNCNCGSSSNNFICPHKKPVMLENLSLERRLHKAVLLKYGGVCNGCGETELGFLTIEHINGGGGREVQESFKGKPYKFYRYLRDNLIRNDITILCYNCNCDSDRRSIYLG